MTSKVITGTLSVMGALSVTGAVASGGDVTVLNNKYKGKGIQFYTGSADGSQLIHFSANTVALRDSTGTTYDNFEVGALWVGNDLTAVSDIIAQRTVGFGASGVSPDVFLRRTSANTLTMSITETGSQAGGFFCGSVTTGTITGTTIQGTEVKVKYGGSAYTPIPMTIYSHSSDLSVPSGTTDLISVSIAAGLVGTNGDVLVVEAWGNCVTAATTTRTIQLRVNGSIHDGFNLVSGSTNTWYATWSLARRSATLCDIFGRTQHGGTTVTIGGIDRAVTSFSSAGSIVLQTIATTSNEFRLRTFQVKFFPKYTP